MCFNFKSKVCLIYTKSSKTIIWNITKCHIDTIFGCDLHLVVHYIKWLVLQRNS
jgi:hypothetical protein